MAMAAVAIPGGISLPRKALRGQGPRPFPGSPRAARPPRLRRRCLRHRRQPAAAQPPPPQCPSHDPTASTADAARDHARCCLPPRGAQAAGHLRRRAAASNYVFGVDAPRTPTSSRTPHRDDAQAPGDVEAVPRAPAPAMQQFDSAISGRYDGVSTERRREGLRRGQSSGLFVRFPRARSRSASRRWFRLSRRKRQCCRLRRSRRRTRRPSRHPASHRLARLEALLAPRIRAPAG